ncbi:MAG: class I SAM-dependent methyltransferase [Saprospirales bacterium]|nr:MAG: class I SAM-dependent methyltransferase [Saprospirales bacterium]
MKQRLDEWTKGDNHEYFDRQFKKTYQSTIKFCDWLEQLEVLNRESSCNIMDIGTGKGANLNYMNKRFPNCKFLGLDINKNLVDEGNAYFKNKNINNCKLECGDLYNLDYNRYKNGFEGIISYQTLSWLPEYKKSLSKIIKLNPNWISLTSLFYDGLVDCKIEINEFENPKKKNSFKTSFYNVYSLPRLEYFFKKKGYKSFKSQPFVIDIDLPKPDHTLMHTYTKKLENGERIQISGPLLLNWFFIYAEKK